MGRDLDDVADDVDLPGGRVTVTALRQAHPNRRVGDGRTEDRDVRPVGRREDAAVLGFLPQAFAEFEQELARGVRPALELQHEARDPLVVLAELVFARERVIDAVDAFGGQRGVIDARGRHEVPAPAGLVEVMVQVGAGGHEAVDVPVLDEVRDDEAHAAGREGPGHPEEDRHIAAQHAFPDAARDGQVPPLKGHPLHLRQHVVGRQIRRDRERFDRFTEEAVTGDGSSACSFYRRRVTFARKPKSAVGDRVRPASVDCATMVFVRYQRLT